MALRPRALCPLRRPSVATLGAVIAVLVLAAGCSGAATKGAAGSGATGGAGSGHHSTVVPPVLFPGLLGLPTSGTPQWSHAVAVAGFAPIERVSSAAAAFCVAASYPDEEQPGTAEAIGGTPGAPSWSSTGNIGFGSDAGLSCTSGGFCALVDGQSDVRTLLHGRWSVADPVDPAGHLQGISCVSPSSCVAVDNGGNAVEMSDGKWSPPIHVGRVDNYMVSCASTTFCMGANDDGQLFEVRGGQWGPAMRLDVAAYPSAVSCASPTFCIVVDGAGRAALFDGTWGPFTTIDPGQVLTSVSCPAVGFCVAADGAGHVLALTSGRWGSAVGVVDLAGGVSAVSCSSSRFCVAVSATEAVVFAPPTAT